MSFSKVTAIFDELTLEHFEREIKRLGVSGYTIHQVKGRGRFSATRYHNPAQPHVMVDIYISRKNADQLAKEVLKILDVGADSEGIVSVTSIDDLYWVCGQEKVDTEQFSLEI
jgi:nitrogen regulatory protein P-II 1